MATIDFPTSPTLNQTYTFNGRTWVWDGSGWSLQQDTLTYSTITNALGYKPLNVNGDTLVGNLTITTGTIIANGSPGVANQVLTSNGTGLYWANAAAGGNSAFIKQQYVANGTQTTFNVATGYQTNSLVVFLNGVMLRQGIDVTLDTPTTFTLTNPPATGALIDILGTSSSFSNTGGYSTIVQQSYTANGSANSFTVTGGYTPNQVLVFLNGVKQVNGVDVIVSSGSTVNFITTPANNYSVEVYGYVTSLINSSTWNRQSFTANGTSNTFLVTNGYTPNNIDVYLNGVHLTNTSFDASDGAYLRFYTPPANNTIIDVVAAVPGINYNDITFSTGGFVSGGSLGINQIIMLYGTVKPFLLPSNFIDSIGLASNNGIVNTVFGIYKNSTQIGTMTFPAGNNTPVFAGNGATFANGDFLKVIGPPAPDPNLADFSFTFKGTKI